MKHLNLKKNVAKGFSLVEMLVVIAVIGVIAAIAIPSIGSINGAAQTATYQRNAQTIMSIYESGLAAGASWTPTPTDAASVITAVGTGAYGTGNFSTVFFQAPGLPTDSASLTAIEAHITGTAPNFTYTP